MPLSKAKKREYMKQRRVAQKRAAGAHLLSRADVRAMRRAGLSVEDLEGEQGQSVTFQAFSALMRDRDAVSAHLSWHHESASSPDALTRLERLTLALDSKLEANDRKLVEAEQRQARLSEKVQTVMAYNVQLEADLARLELMMDSMLREGELS